jgi:hypothetical protein
MCLGDISLRRMWKIKEVKTLLKKCAKLLAGGSEEKY